MSGGLTALILSSGWMAKFVLLVLLGFSIATWSVILMKWRTFRDIKAANRDFMDAYSRAKNLSDLKSMPNLPTHYGIGFIFKDGMEKVARHKESGGFSVEWLAGLERRLRGTMREEISNQETYLAVLATTGNVAPFIGLLGTVLGIITAFQEIAVAGSASISAVAPGVAEALVATAAGLFAAIPAVVAFNYFMNQVRSQAAQMETFSIEFTDLVHESGMDEK